MKDVEEKHYISIRLKIKNYWKRLWNSPFVTLWNQWKTEYNYSAVFLVLMLFIKKNKLFNFKRQARFAENLEKCSRLLRLFKAKMGTLACDDFYENASPAANFHGLKTGSRTTKSRHYYYESTAGWNNANAFNQTAHYISRKKDEKRKIIVAVYLVYF